MDIAQSIVEEEDKIICKTEPNNPTSTETIEELEEIVGDLPNTVMNCFTFIQLKLL